VLPGLILLFFIAAIGAFFLSKARRRMGMATPKIWIPAIFGFAIVILVAYVAQSNN
jgi:hypothetical protein